MSARPVWSGSASSRCWPITPTFEITCLAASAKSAGRPYAEAVKGRWKLQGADAGLRGADARCGRRRHRVPEGRVRFRILRGRYAQDEIRALETAYAQAELPVVSNNSAHRWTPDVPMVIPEINPEHLDVIAAQRKRLGTKGLHRRQAELLDSELRPRPDPLRAYGVQEVLVTTFKPFPARARRLRPSPKFWTMSSPIGGEEEKSEKRTAENLGAY